MLREKVKSLLESTLEQTVLDVARRVYEQKYGEPLRKLVKYGDYNLRQEILNHASKITVELLESDEEVKQLVRDNLKATLLTMFGGENGAAEDAEQKSEQSE